LPGGNAVIYQGLEAVHASSHTNKKTIAGRDWKRLKFQAQVEESKGSAPPRINQVLN